MLVVLTVVLGVVYTLIARASQPWRVALGGHLFALTGWAALQYFLLPAIQPLVTEKGFTPEWYALSFAVYGAVLGTLLAIRRQPETEQPPPVSQAPRTSPASASRSDIDAWREEMRRLREDDGG